MGYLGNVNVIDTLEDTSLYIPHYIYHVYMLTLEAIYRLIFKYLFICNLTDYLSWNL